MKLLEFKVVNGGTGLILADQIAGFYENKKLGVGSVLILKSGLELDVKDSTIAIKGMLQGI
ncbi:hypothetical protein ABXT06_04540 [Flavobacterium sp. UW10123]|uniref:hypothetical protein n=1 Tax=Flavobacterium sp. UW10123 TaxID=3230800 RepID=UPI00218AD322|nr:hypothetical protein phicjt23_gp14 [Flavobacterium phage phiCjT23]